MIHAIQCTVNYRAERFVFFLTASLVIILNSYISNVSQRRDRIDSGDHAARSRFMLRELLNSNKKRPKTDHAVSSAIRIPDKAREYHY
jgi:hypothetical protein